MRKSSSFPVAAMTDYRALLASEPARLAAIDAFVLRLKTRGPSIPARFSEAGRNLEDESNLNLHFWHAISDLLIRDGYALSLPDIEDKLSSLFRSYQRQGPKVAVPRTRYGRLFKRSDFVDSLMRDKIKLPRTKAEAKVDKLARVGAPQAAMMLQFKELGRFLMWSTYCESCDCSDPFNPRTVAAKLVDSLGLCFRSGDQFLLFVYELPRGVDRFTPTIADAYGGNFFFPFRPGGRTHPIRYQDELSGRPEVVHVTITGRYLASPIQILEPDDSIHSGIPK